MASSASIARNPQPCAAGRPRSRIQVIAAQPGSTIEVAPGKSIVPLPADDVQTVAIAELVPTGDGQFRQIARICPRWFRVSRDDLVRLHITISEMTMRRLVEAGFIRGGPITPWVYQFDVYSYFDHVARVEADHDFWSQKEDGHHLSNLERYRKVL